MTNSSNPPSDSPSGHDPLAKLRELLSHESFPLDYVHKLIGNNDPTFHAGLGALESEFPTLVRQSERLSASSKHLAVTYMLRAPNVDLILNLVRRSQTVPGLVVQL
jgi:hypothetical protein